ncbi:MAG TPA: heavy-metal-associated domain-containing protein [Bacteroidales bacterium]
MKILKFKTNINCNGCIAKVTPSLNQVKGILKWEVDISNPQKILSIESSDISEYEIISVLKNAGYNAEKL